MCEKVWRIVQVCAKKQGLATGSRGWLTACKPLECCTRAKHARSWRVAPVVALQDKVPGWLGRLLVALTRNLTQSQGQVVRTPCLEKINFSHSFLPYYIYTLIPTILRELPERILREKPQRQTKLIHPQSSYRDSSNSSTLFLSIVISLRGTLPKPFLTIPISVRRPFGVWEAVKKGLISY